MGIEFLIVIAEKLSIFFGEVGRKVVVKVSMEGKGRCRSILEGVGRYSGKGWGVVV